MSAPSTPVTHTLTARRLVTDIGEIEFPVLTVAADGTLADISSDPRALAGETTVLTAAFLDIHTHGAMGHDVMSATPAGFAELGRFLATHGVAHYLPTTVTASIDDTLHALDRLATAIEAGAALTAATNAGAPHLASEMWASTEARPIGIHLEGPFLSHPKRGVHPAALLQPPSVELFDRFQAAARGHIALLTLAPELPNALDLTRHASALGVRVSLGHSNATAAETLAAIDAGARSATHTFNAMRALDHREPGILGTVLDDPRLFAELIADGVHVAPALVRLWLKAKGPARGLAAGSDRAILVTDSMSATGMPDGPYSLAGLAVTVSDGRAVLTAHPETLAGSVLTLDRAVANLQQFAGIPAPEAARFASHNPAALLGRPELTRLAPGSAANLNRFDARGRLLATYLNGHPVPTTA